MFPVSLPPKPVDSTWTDDQWSAIVSRGQNTLVAAAAGSGKTAVLVERIIRRITDAEEPVDVDRLLVATFTKAAASEMKQRIREALEQELFRQPDSEFLRRQLALVHRASVTTLHSFCLEVVQRYFQDVRLDPGFRIAGETEADLLRFDVLEGLLESYYAVSEEGSSFWRLVDSFSGDRSDEALYRLILRLYDYSRSHPWPDHWLRETASAFSAADEAAFSAGNVWLDSLMRDVRLELNGALGVLREALKLAELPGGPAPYADNLREDMTLFEYLLEVCERQTWEHAYHAFQGAAFGKLKPCKGDDCDKELQERVKALREQAKKLLNGLKDELFQRPPSAYYAELRQLAPVLDTLVELVAGFGEQYRKAKADKGWVDFSDLEHYCLQILRHPDSTPNRLAASEAAMQYQEQFAEVLLDEYQDTNMVQEAIVQLISRPGAGNRFMVGDVKQSIYRFRLAEPGLFLDKYRTYRHDGSGTGLKIDLARNFRSRKEVVDGTNFIFKQIMNETVGEIVYDERAELVYGASYPEAGADIHFAGREFDFEAQADASRDAAVTGFAAEMVLIDRDRDRGAVGSPYDDDDSGTYPSGGTEGDEEEASAEAGNAWEQEKREMETAVLEARLIAGQIRELMGGNGKKPFGVYDKKTGGTRDIRYRDIVFLLRATQAWAPVILEELRFAGIPAYAELGSGYFSATEVEVMISLLKVIDNPYQDIPLAAVLRSPICQLTTDELARLRLIGKRDAFYDNVSDYITSAKRQPAPEMPNEADASNINTFADSGFVQPDYLLAEQEAAAASSLVERGARVAAVPDGDITAQVGVRDAELLRKLQTFQSRLGQWRTDARQGSLADLIWRIYAETGYFDFVGGLPGGAQRQANLRALYDRSRQYEATSLTGVFRFLRFLERMRDSGGDLGTARALGEQEDVVRVMSIHKSKGLEFPIVFVAGLAKMFNRQDLNAGFLLHKQLGFGPKFVDPELRISYPTLPVLAIRRRMRMELLAEEMRVLYVALTRAKEKLYLVGTVRNTARLLADWGRQLDNEEQTLSDYTLAKAGSYLDWIGPALIRHPQATLWRSLGQLPEQFPGAAIMQDERSRWTFRHIGAADLPEPTDAISAGTNQPDERSLAALRSVVPWPDEMGNSETDETMGRQADPDARIGAADDRVNEVTALADEIARRFDWSYDYAQAIARFAKTSISEMKRMEDWFEAESEIRIGVDEQVPGPPAPGGGVRSNTDSEGKFAEASASLHRPRFMERHSLTPAERGTAYHTVMQHMPVYAAGDAAADALAAANGMNSAIIQPEDVAAFIDGLVERQLLTDAQRGAVDCAAVAAFFASPLGDRLSRAASVRREVPFSYGLPASEAYPDADDRLADETVLIQGVIDLLFQEEDGWVLVDYKTDRLRGSTPQQAAERHKLQLGLYSRAVEHIWKTKVKETYLYFFDGAHFHKVSG